MNFWFTKLASYIPELPYWLTNFAEFLPSFHDFSHILAVISFPFVVAWMIDMFRFTRKIEKNTRQQ